MMPKIASASINPRTDLSSLEVRLDRETAWHRGPGAIGRIVWGQSPCHKQALKKYIFCRQIGGGGSYFHFGNNCSRAKKYRTRNYNLAAIIAVGHRVSSDQATRFRQWATRILRDRIVHR